MSMIKNFEAMLARGQDTAMLRYSLGNEYLKEKQFEQAAEHFGKAVELDPKYSAAWKGYGKALAEAEQIDQAITVYTQGIEVAEERGDKQAVKEMQVFLKRLHKKLAKRNE